MKIVGVFLISLLLLLAAIAAMSNRFHPMGAPVVDIQRGQAVFDGNCAGCHSVAKGQAAGLGPALAGIAVTAATRIEDTSAEEFILQSILYPDAYKMQGSQGAMPGEIGASLSDSELRDLVGYLMNLEGHLDSRAISSLQIVRPKTEAQAGESIDWTELQQGYELFSSKYGCGSCHEILEFPSNNLLAPSLQHAAVLDEKYIRQSIRDPSAVIAPTYREVRLTTVDGSSYTGRELLQDDEHIEIISGIPVDPVRQKFDKANLESIWLSDRSSMPAYQLTEREEDLIVGFLKFLGDD